MSVIYYFCIVCIYESCIFNVSELELVIVILAFYTGFIPLLGRAKSLGVYTQLLQINIKTNIMFDLLKLVSQDYFLVLEKCFPQ